LSVHLFSAATTRQTYAGSQLESLAAKLTEAEAWAKWKAIKKDGVTKESESDRAKAYLMKLRKDLSALVESGKMSEEAAKRKYAAAEKAVKERMAAGRGERGEKVDWEAIKKRIEGAVKAGKITREEANAKYKAIKERMAEQRER
jgi:phosphoribosylanthranilate isomerase